MNEGAGSWKVRVQSRVARSSGYFYLMIIGLVAVLGVVRIGIPQQYVAMMGWGVGLLVAVVSIWVSMIQLTGRSGVLEVAGARVTLRSRRKTRELVLHRCRVELSKHFSAANYRYFIGSLLSITDRESGEQILLLGSGVELQGPDYSGDSETFGAAYDAYLGAGEFRDLLTALGPRLKRGGAGAGKEAPVEAPGLWGAEESLAFEAQPIWNFGGRSMLIWLLGTAVVGLLGSALVVGPGRDLVAEHGVWLLGLVLIPALLLVGYLAGRQRSDRCTIQLDPGRVTIFNRGRMELSLTPPFTRLIPGELHVRTRYNISYCGPAIRLEDRLGQRLVLGMSNPQMTWTRDRARIRRIKYMVSPDAGEALVRWLASATKDPRLVLVPRSSPVDPEGE